MKFGTGKLYIESYNKCSNCGVLIYEASMHSAIQKTSGLFCSEWCESWSDERVVRRGTSESKSAVRR